MSAIQRGGRRRPRRSRLGQFGIGLALVAAGAGVLTALLHLPARLDALLLVSRAISNLITGLARLGLALLQFVALVLLVAVALGGVLALVAGAVRMARALVAGPRGQQHPSTVQSPQPVAGQLPAAPQKHE